MTDFGPVGDDAHEWGYCDDACPHPSHLLCAHGWSFRDYDGSAAFAPCTNRWVVTIHGWDAFAPYSEGPFSVHACLECAPQVRRDMRVVEA